MTDERLDDNFFIPPLDRRELIHLDAEEIALLAEGGATPDDYLAYHIERCGYCKGRLLRAAKRQGG